MDAGRGLEGRSVPCGRFPSLFAASVWSVREAAPRLSSAYCWFAIASSFRFEKPLERPIAPVVATASAEGQGCESIEILRGPSGNTGREGSCCRRAERRQGGHGQDQARSFLAGLMIATGTSTTPCSSSKLTRPCKRTSPAHSRRRGAR
jgi:hypothetical protein